MNKLITLGASTAVLAAGLLGSGVANADDQVVGQTYGDAQAALNQRGFTTEIATKVGDRKNTNACLVTSVNRAPSIDGYGLNRGSVVLVNLNCYATYGTALNPGFSIGSPEGRKLYEADLARQKKREAQQRAAAAQN